MSGRLESKVRIVALSTVGAFLAPLVFVSILVLRKVERRLSFHTRIWNKRLQHEIARWS